MTITLVGLLLSAARACETPTEKEHQAQLAGMMNDPMGKVFTTAMTDQCFRSRQPSRIANQLIYLIQKYGIPSYLPFNRRIALWAFRFFGQTLSKFIVPLTRHMIRQETASVILPGEENALLQHIDQRQREGVRINLNHIGEAILGENEAETRLKVYLEDLAKPEVEYISIKISTIYSQINLLAHAQTLEVLAERLRLLYRAAKSHHFTRTDGEKVQKFVNLDMEEYKDLHLTVALFQKVLEEPEFHDHLAGLVLQSYLPDSYPIQQELTQWAVRRVALGGAPIKIRIVKGANLAMEQVEAALRLWPQAPYTTKGEVDANFKRMVIYGCHLKQSQAVHLGIGSHNLFDIAYTMLLRSENQVEDNVSFEMLEGMADPLRRVVQNVSGGMLLYCPAATKNEFQNAVAYLVRRLDENTAPENFLRHLFSLKEGTPEWDQQVEQFSKSCDGQEAVSVLPRRDQDRLKSIDSPSFTTFQNIPDTDWSLPNNVKWAEAILEEWKQKKYAPIPQVISGKKFCSVRMSAGINPSDPTHPFYDSSLATWSEIDMALKAAKNHEMKAAASSLVERAHLLEMIARGLSQKRADLIGAMVADTGKTVVEADVEVSEAIDFATYYRQSLLEWSKMEDLRWTPKGTILVASPWNFPCSIPAGGILAALATGNCVIFKPASESILVGWELAKIFWEAGVSREILQFVTCVDDPVGSELIKDPRVNGVVLTGATSTAKLFLKMRPALDLMAETGGKNTMVITSMADRDLAIKDLLHSAFSYAGQKCSACSLAILEAEVYDDPHFRQTLRDAAKSLCVGSPWNLQAKINPLIRPPEGALRQGLTKLEKGEGWLLEPKQDEKNPHLWSPGIKLGVQPGNFTFNTELFGPVLGLVRAENFEHALEIMNQTPYGLTAGLHSLDEREQNRWLEKIEAGNCYINRTVTGAVVERQPFGGCKESSFGKGVKAGGPNYLTSFQHVEQISLPKDQKKTNVQIKILSEAILKDQLLKTETERSLWQVSIGSYAYYWYTFFNLDHDPCSVLGQDNIQRYVPRKLVIFRMQQGDILLDILRLIAAALTTQTPLEVSISDSSVDHQLSNLPLSSLIHLVEESEVQLIARLAPGQRIRLLRHGDSSLHIALANASCHTICEPVFANGRLALLPFLQEISISRDYHRYGNLGVREHELRRPLSSSQPSTSGSSSHE